MTVTKGLPEGGTIRLQEAITWAFTGWSWSKATASLNDIHEIEQSDDFPAKGSIYSLILSEQSMERDKACLNFDISLTSACLGGKISLIGRRPGSKDFEAIPKTYFARPRGFSYLYGEKIYATAIKSSIDAILADGRDGNWQDVLVEWEQFFGWFTASKSLILGLPLDDGSEMQTSEALPTGLADVEMPPADIGPISPPVFGSPEYLKKSRAVRKLDATKWYVERVAKWPENLRHPHPGDDERTIKDLFGLGRKFSRDLRREHAPEAWHKTGSDKDE